MQEVIFLKELVIGTRGSDLALTQTKWIKDKIKKIHPETNVKIQPIKTTGDKIKDKPLFQKGGKGLFIKEIEIALLKREIDIAVHSLKDIPGEIKEEFELACYPCRENPLDVLISPANLTLSELPENAVLGTGSLRRQNQLKNFRPDFKFVHLRGNVETRIKKMKQKQLDGIILAAAGLHRLGLEDIVTQYISADISIPAVGQGTLGIEILRERRNLKEFLQPLNHFNTGLQSKAERQFLKTVSGSCNLPLGAYAEIIENNENSIIIEIKAFLSNTDGDNKIIENYRHTFSLDKPDNIINEKIKDMGQKLAEKVLNSGGSNILTSLEEEENHE